MVQRKIECLASIQDFLTMLKKEISVEKTYLFGSYASGEAHGDSDVDLAIISRDFESMSPLDRLVLLGKIAWRAGTPEIEAIGFTPDEFYKGHPWDFPAEVLRTGEQVS